MKYSKSMNLALAALFVSSTTFAADAPLKVSAKFELSGNETFFELMSKSNGIKAALDEDYSDSFEVVDAKTFRKKSANFSHIKKLEAKLVENGMNTLISALAGKVVKEEQLYGKIMSILTQKKLFKGDAKNQSRFAGALAPIIGIASGKGVLVQLDNENYCYNFGYAKGSGGTDAEKDKMERRTGRSYGASVSRNAYDPSDNDYLKILSAYTSEASDAELKKFYTVIFSILLKSDSSGLASLSEEGQLVVADFMAIYMAELDRHLMTGLTKYEWENALTEITILAAYSATNEGKTFDPNGGVENVNGRSTTSSSKVDSDKRMVGFFGVGTDGSGLDGMNKKYRHALTKKIVDAERKLNADLVSEIETLTGAREGSDIYDSTMNAVNSYKGQKLIKKNSSALIKNLVNFAMATRKDAAKISKMIQ